MSCMVSMQLLGIQNKTKALCSPDYDADTVFSLHYINKIDEPDIYKLYNIWPHNNDIIVCYNIEVLLSLSFMTYIPEEVIETMASTLFPC